MKDPNLNNPHYWRMVNELKERKAERDWKLQKAFACFWLAGLLVVVCLMVFGGQKDEGNKTEGENVEKGDPGNNEYTPERHIRRKGWEK